MGLYPDPDRLHLHKGRPLETLGPYYTCNVNSRWYHIVSSPHTVSWYSSYKIEKRDQPDLSHCWNYTYLGEGVIGVLNVIPVRLQAMRYQQYASPCTALHSPSNRASGRPSERNIVRTDTCQTVPKHVE